MATPPPELQQIASPTPAYRLAALLLGSGVGHFVIPKPYDAIVPAELPGSARFYTYASGVAELASGALLLFPRTRRVGALAAIAVFVAVFPANLNLVRLWRRKPWPMRAAAIVWLPLQIPIITQAVKVLRRA
ncbi:MAG TPA: MauE/DoxX family redox-associated membrane protein [Mycobacterium sp.]|nr:MauE/DoxX family redox-associated membrane protein [Mycobacterium sp.]